MSSISTFSYCVMPSQISPESTVKQLSVPQPAYVEQAPEEEEDEYEEVEVDVPYTYQVEEVEEREEMHSVPVEKAVPQIKALYAYKGQGMAVEKGEVSTSIECVVQVTRPFDPYYLCILVLLKGLESESSLCMFCSKVQMAHL